VMRTTEEILRLVPGTLREASLGLGATRWRTTWSILLPAARSGIITGVMLALARVSGETAPLLFTAFGNLAFNVRLDRPIDALPLSIFYNATSPYDYLKVQAQAGAIILVLLILILSLVTRYVTRNRFGEG
jgi:phosphate transport system permease protein